MAQIICVYLMGVFCVYGSISVKCTLGVAKGCKLCIVDLMKSLLDKTEWKYNADEEEVAAFYLPVSIMRNPNISCKAKVVWAYMNARPKGWDFSSHRIAKSMKESYQPIQRAIKELEEHRYLTRSRRPDGRFVYELALDPPLLMKDEGVECLKYHCPQSMVNDDFVCVNDAICRIIAAVGLCRSDARVSALDWQKSCQE